MRRIYFDTNQMFYIRRIAEEAEGFDYGSFGWAFRAFQRNPDLIEDIRALWYIVALQYEWDLDFLPSNASFAELCVRTDNRALATQEAWREFSRGLKEGRTLRAAEFSRDKPLQGSIRLGFISDPDDRVIVRHFASEEADVLLTSDRHILEHKARLAGLGLTVMRPSEWLNTFLDRLRGNENGVDWLERILFGIGG